MVTGIQSKMGQILVMNAYLRHRRIQDGGEFFELLMEQIQIKESLLVVNHRGIIVFASEPAAALLGYMVSPSVLQ